MLEAASRPVCGASRSRFAPCAITMLACAALVGCGSDTPGAADAAGPADATIADATHGDATAIDATIADAGAAVADAPTTDGAISDAVITDATPADAAADARPVDGGPSSCHDCHGGPINDAPPDSTTGETATSAMAVGAHQSHVTDLFLHRAFSCDQCHVVPTAIGDADHIDEAPAEVVWGELATVGGAVPQWDRETGTCSDTYCHGNYPGGNHVAVVWTQVGSGQAACGTCHDAPPAGHFDTDCRVCHSATIEPSWHFTDKHIDGQIQGQISGTCDLCHEAPPPTGSHLAHYGATAAEASYGGTGGTATLSPGGAAYAFDCGNCHPIDAGHHGNAVLNTGGGRAEIDLSPAGAPAGSLRAMNPATASYQPGGAVLVDARGFAYTEGTCSDVYCHSAATVEVVGPVAVPGTDFLFDGYPLIVANYQPAHTVVASRSYATTPAWGGVASCDACHGFPPRTASPAVTAGAGDSHSWINPGGYETLHGAPHGFTPIACATCHYDTVTDPGTRGRDATGWSVYQPVAIANHERHVDGRADVAFTDSPVAIRPNAVYDLTTAGYDPESRTCADVGCHKLQTSVEWGLPYRRPISLECNSCHQY